MSKHAVTHACGHVITHDLSGNRNDRARRERWLEGTDCGECYRAKRVAESKAEAAAAAQTVGKTWVYPPLKGTEKQVRWATDLRLQVMARVEGLLKAEFDAVAYLDVHGLVQAELNELTSASYWIDQKSMQKGLAVAILYWALTTSVEQASDVRVTPEDLSEGRVLFRGLPFRMPLLQLTDGAMSLALSRMEEDRWGELEDWKDEAVATAREARKMQRAS